MLPTERYASELHNVLFCYDRILIHGNIADWCFPEGMIGFLNARKIRIFDYATFTEPLTEAIRKNAEQIAQESGVEIEFIRKVSAFRKEDRLAEIIRQRGEQPGLVHIFSAMEGCNTCKPWHDNVRYNGRREQASLALKQVLGLRNSRYVAYNGHREHASLALKQVLGLRPAELALRLVAPDASISALRSSFSKSVTKVCAWTA